MSVIYRNMNGCFVFESSEDLFSELSESFPLSDVKAIMDSSSVFEVDDLGNGIALHEHVVNTGFGRFVTVYDYYKIDGDEARFIESYNTYVSPEEIAI